MEFILILYDYMFGWYFFRCIGYICMVGFGYLCVGVDVFCV